MNACDRMRTQGRSGNPEGRTLVEISLSIFFWLLEDSTDVFLKMMSYTLKYELCVDS